MPIKSKKAQSILEYATIGALVVIGIIVMGPYVIRSLNANFKMWEDEVHDAHSEPLLQAPPIQPDSVPPCVCRPKPTGTICGTRSCPPTHKLIQQDCQPVGCALSPSQVVEECVADPACCSIMLRTEYCGKTPLPTTTPIPVTPTKPQQCHYRYRLYEGLCGANLYQFRCDLDRTTADGDPSCDAVCLDTYHTEESFGGAVPNHVLALLCPDDDKDLNRDTRVTLTATNGVGSCTPATKCETYCRTIAGIRYVNILGTCTACGNGVCDAGLGENFSNCATDCCALVYNEHPGNYRPANGRNGYCGSHQSTADRICYEAGFADFNGTAGGRGYNSCNDEVDDAWTGATYLDAGRWRTAGDGGCCRYLPSISCTRYAGYCPAACGNGRIDAGETCDDGGSNGTAISCCSVKCTIKHFQAGCPDVPNGT